MIGCGEIWIFIRFPKELVGLANTAFAAERYLEGAEGRPRAEMGPSGHSKKGKREFLGSTLCPSQ